MEARTPAMREDAIILQIVARVQSRDFPRIAQGLQSLGFVGLSTPSDSPYDDPVSPCFHHYHGRAAVEGLGLGNHINQLVVDAGLT